MRDMKRQNADEDGNEKNVSLMPLTDEQIKAFEEATI